MIDRFGSYLVMLFLFTKLLYIANSIGQFFLLNVFLFDGFNVYGFGLLGNVRADHDWEEAHMNAFPRVTMCDFDIRRLGECSKVRPGPGGMMALIVKLMTTVAVVRVN